MNPQPGGAGTNVLQVELVQEQSSHLRTAAQIEMFIAPHRYRVVDASMGQHRVEVACELALIGLFIVVVYYPTHPLITAFFAAVLLLIVVAQTWRWYQTRSAHRVIDSDWVRSLPITCSDAPGRLICYGVSTELWELAQTEPGWHSPMVLQEHRNTLGRSVTSPREIMVPWRRKEEKGSGVFLSVCRWRDSCATTLRYWGNRGQSPLFVGTIAIYR